MVENLEFIEYELRPEILEAKCDGLGKRWPPGWDKSIFTPIQEEEHATKLPIYDG